MNYELCPPAGGMNYDWLLTAEMINQKTKRHLVIQGGQYTNDSLFTQILHQFQLQINHLYSDNTIVQRVKSAIFVTNIGSQLFN